MTSRRDQDEGQDTAPNSAETHVLNKRKRNGRACDRCHRLACRCSPGIEGVECSRCEEMAVPCTYERPAKKRGPPPRNRRESNATEVESQQPQSRTQVLEQTTIASGEDDGEHPPDLTTASQDERTSAFTPRSGGRSEEILGGDQCCNDNAGNQSTNSGRVPTASAEFPDVVQPDVVEKLVEVFHHTAYPLRPYFHWPTYRAQVRTRQYRTDWGLWTFTMAVCTMASGRLCDGVLMPSLGGEPLRLQANSLFNKCYNASIKAFPVDILTVPDAYHAMKAKAILASACLQDGDWRKAVVHLGDYASLSAVTGFCQESNWPVGINEIQRQERRRVHWGVYQQEQYLSSSFGFPSRQREADAIVKYPAEVSDDEDITQTSVCCQLDELSFLVGWNFCTDLYRLLERLRGSAKAAPQMPRMEPGNKIESFLSKIQPSKQSIASCLHLVTELYEELPSDLRRVKGMTGDSRTDRYGFVACNVLLTTQTLRMLLVGINKPSVHLRCAIASELLDELSSIPMAFFNASSIVSLHHLARIGHILSDITKDTLPIWTYLQVRNILIVLADLLEKIESARLSNAGTALKLRAEIDRIRNCIKQASQNDQQQTSQLSMSQSLLTDWRNASTGSPATESTDRTNMTRSPGAPNGSSRTAMQVSSQYADHAHDWPPGESILVGHGLDSMREIQRNTSVPTTFNPLMIPPNHQSYGAISMSQPGTMQEQQDMQFDAAHGQRLGVDNLLSGDFFFSQWPYLAS